MAGEISEWNVAGSYMEFLGGLINLEDSYLFEEDYYNALKISDRLFERIAHKARESKSKMDLFKCQEELEEELSEVLKNGVGSEDYNNKLKEFKKNYRAFRLEVRILLNKYGFLGKGKTDPNRAVTDLY